VLALLALALFPVSAFAGNAGETVYETEVPTIESQPSTGGNSGKSPTHHSTPNTGQGETAQATGSKAGTGGGAEEGSGSGNHKKEGSSSKEEEGNPSTAVGGNGNKPNGGANAGGSEGSIGESKDLGGTQQGANASSSSGGSSPVVPILIAVVVLAAISIGVVLYRQRKSGQGGSDGRVSSSNAS
jgi:cobalamin biosynthesis Mg chelatase CobN